MKVLFAIDGTFVGGGHRHVMLLAQGLQNAGGSAHVLVSGEGSFTEELNRHRIRWTVVPMGKQYSSEKTQCWRNAVDEIELDILHLHGGVAGFWGRLSARQDRRMKIVHTLHGIHYLHSANKFISAVSLVADWFLKARTDMTICVSQADLKTASAWRMVDPRKTRVIHNGVEVKSFQERRRGSTALSNPIRLGVVGRLTKMKGQKDAIKALSLLKEKYPLTLTFYGTGEDLELLTKIAKAEGVGSQVFFAGYQSNMPAVYPQIDVHVLPSLWEGQPLTLFESLAAGVPTVISGLDCVREVVTDGKECLLVPSKNPSALAAAIDRILSDESLRKRLSSEGSVASSQFDIAPMLKKTFELYEEVLRS